jgi:lipopolysaccharide/colanic/teichoic acid biosynthesis glycosyltransferase
MNGWNYRKKPFYEVLKRLFDVFFSFLILVVLSWFILLVALLVWLTSKGPAFYLHERIGRNGKPFKLIKFRTMKHDARPIQEQLTHEQYLEYLKDFKVTKDPRITKMGNLLRRTSVDEIPQLINILKGEMSFVGPRPLIAEETVKFGNYRDTLLKVKPGLTGYWAVNGRNCTSYEKRIELELYYVTHRSIGLDIAIFFKTIGVVFTGKGAE